MKQNPVFSIIMPVYNAERYLERALSSIRMQTFADFELIMINDGSTDRSRDICSRYAEEDARFLLFSQKNQGVATARNAALANVHGRYLVFVDSDDWVSADLLKRAYEEVTAGSEEMVIWDYFQIDENDHELAEPHVSLHPGICDRKNYLAWLSPFPQAHYVGVLWNKVYDMEIIRAHGIRFDTQLNLGEDFIFNMDYLKYVHTMKAISDRLYHYRWMRKDSITTTKKEPGEYALERLRLYQAYKNLYQNAGLDRKWKYRMHRYIFWSYFNGLEEAGENRKAAGKLLENQLVLASGISRPEFYAYVLARKLVRVLRSLKR